MVIISQAEFKKKWNDSDKEENGVQFHLGKDEIQEWKETGKFAVVKEYCESRNYDIWFCMLENDWFGFIFRNEGDVNKMIGLHIELLHLHKKEDIANVRVLGRKEKDHWVDYRHQNTNRK